MKKVIRLTESELNTIIEKSVRRAINEGAIDEYNLRDFGRDSAIGLGVLGAGIAGDVYFNGDENDVNQDQIEMNRPAEEEFGVDALRGGKHLPNDTIGWEEAQNMKMENRIHRAIMESVRKVLRKKL